MQPRIQDSPNRAPLIVLVIGLVLSVVMVAPSVRYSALYYTPGHLAGHVVLNVVMLAAVSSPFFLIYLFTRNRAAILSVTFGAVFSVLHAYPIYTTYRFRPQEFGYVGLIFIPFLEAVIGVPSSLLIVFVVRRMQRQR